MTTLGSEHGRDVIQGDDRKPVLYDAKERPLVRPAGFRAATKNERTTADGDDPLMQ